MFNFIDKYGCLICIALFYAFKLLNHFIIKNNTYLNKLALSWLISITKLYRLSCLSLSIKIIVECSISICTFAFRLESEHVTSEIEATSSL